MPGVCAIAAEEATLSTYPRRSITCGRQARTVRQTPSRLTSSVRSNASGSIERANPTVPIPALAIDHVDPAERLDRAVHRRRERAVVGDVGLEEDGAGALGGDALELDRLEADERHARTAGGEPAGRTPRRCRGRRR